LKGCFGLFGLEFQRTWEERANESRVAFIDEELAALITQRNLKEAIESDNNAWSDATTRRRPAKMKGKKGGYWPQDS